MHFASVGDRRPSGSQLEGVLCSIPMVSTVESGRRPAPECRVVGVGASAGGLESLEALFSAVPDGCGLAFVVVQHLSPDFRSMMDELLARRTPLTVRMAEDGLPIEPDHIYLLPPRKEIIIRQRRLWLKDKDSDLALSLPIDHFLRSLADDVGNRAVAVILSGSGSDGSRGIRDVKRCGGLVISEDPESAKFSGMPLSAQATGLVDHICRPPEIAALLEQLARDDDWVEPASMAATASVLRLLRQRFGVNFDQYKGTTVSRRIERRAMLQGWENAEDYLRVLEADSKELGTLYQDLLIGVTQFFRDPEAFAALEQRVVPSILDLVPAEAEVRVWVPGCATGEEAYSMAMLFHDQLVQRQRPAKLKVLATDVHRDSLMAAGAGVYAEEQLANVNPERRERYFSMEPSGHRITQQLRNLIVFAPHNVLDDAPFTSLHLISCRNLLIYFTPSAQKKVLSLFHFGLTTGGYLFLGSSETPGTLSDEFEPVDDHWKLYRKRRDASLVDPTSFSPGKGQASITARQGRLPHRSAEAHLLALYDAVLDRFMPAGFLVGEDRQLVDSFGGAESFLRLRSRRPTTNLLDLVEGDLNVAISGALHRVFSSGTSVQFSSVPVPMNGQVERLGLRVIPVVHPRTNRQYAIITLTAEDRAEATPPDQPPTGLAPQAHPGHVDALESELAYTRETLQTTVEELQTSNEELQSTNEELVASNEELQSTNEELQSVNEELYTVNAEYQRKLSELRELHADMQHLLEGTDVGTLYLDDHLRIRKYTPQLASVFRILPSDVGRSIHDIAYGVDRPQLAEEIEEVLVHGRVVEDEVHGKDGKTFFMRILPYRSSTESDRQRSQSVEPAPISGVVLTLTDISTLDEARDRVRQLSAIVESSQDAITSKDLDGTIRTWNKGAEDLYGYTANEAIGQRAHFLIPEPARALEDDLLRRVARGERIDHVEHTRVRKDGTLVEISLALAPVLDRTGRIRGVSAIARDITPLKKVLRELELRNERVQMLLDSTAEAIVGVDSAGTCTFANAASAHLLGYDSTSELVGRHLRAIVEQHVAADHDAWPILDVLRTGASTHSADEVFRRSSGTEFPVEYWSHPIWRREAIVGAVVTFLDISERKRHEAQIELAAKRREQFLAMLSHELRNPLAAVLNAARVLRDTATHSEVSASARNVIERQSTHMARLLDDLLDVSRITRDKVELQLASMDLRDAIRSAVESVAPLADQRSVAIDLRLPDTIVPVEADHTRMQQVVTNLLTNAVNHSSAGQTVTLDAHTADGRATVRVTDQGTGIAPAHLPHVFDLFVQSDQTIDRSRGGLGVGLTVVRHLVERHGGSVLAHSEGLGRGSKFTFHLPLTATIPTAMSVVRVPAGPLRIAVIEDQDDARDTLCMLLEAQGHEVVSAADGHQGLALITREHPHVAIVDVGLPGINGWELARAVRRIPAIADTLLVALTGYGADDDVTHTIEAGFDEHLTKPAGLDAIQDVLSRARRPNSSSPLPRSEAD